MCVFCELKQPPPMHTHLVHYLSSIPGDDHSALNAALIKIIEEEGLTIRERDFLQRVAERAHQFSLENHYRTKVPAANKVNIT